MRLGEWRKAEQLDELANKQVADEGQPHNI